MTRETKIGLLVGLAFIIVIGILLSDHLTQTNEPQQAQLAQVAGNVRTGVAVPGASSTPAPVATPPTGQVAPQQQIPTKEELSPTKPPVEIVQIGGGGHPAAGGSPAKGRADVATGSGSERPAGGDGSTPIVARPVEPVNGSLNSVAKTMGEELVPAGGDRGATRGNDTQVRPITTPALPTGGKQYTAVPGDSLSKIASKTLGSSSKANCNAIIAANPSLQQNANMVIAGKTYIIPGSPTSATPAPAPSSPPPATPSRISIVADKPPTASAEQGSFYTVKSGDSLTKIAVEQCGSAGAVPAIMDLNKDLLKGGTTIHPNMKLRMPSKPVASAD